jgi:hypothetical protein
MYFNPSTGKKCTIDDYTANSNASFVEKKDGCMKWYTFNDGGASVANINMILDHNTTGLIKWNSSGNNVGGMKEIVSALDSDTSGWKVDLNPRIITVNDITILTKFYAWTPDSTQFYLTNLASTAPAVCTTGNITGCKYKWIYDRTSSTCSTYGCVNNAEGTYTGSGYWTATPSTSSSNSAWGVDKDGKLSIHAIDNDTYAGVRPVITVRKNDIK